LIHVAGVDEIPPKSAVDTVDADTTPAGDPGSEGCVNVDTVNAPGGASKANCLDSELAPVNDRSAGDPEGGGGPVDEVVEWTG